MSEQKPPTVIELIQQTRTIPVTNYDAIANQLIQFSELSNKQAMEIQRLQEILRKNNIQFTHSPQESVKLPENVAVTSEPKVETPPTSQS